MTHLYGVITMRQGRREISIPVSAEGRYVRIQLAGQNWLSLAEVECAWLTRLVFEAFVSVVQKQIKGTSLHIILQ
jgi:hypothetical protein